MHRQTRHLMISGLVQGVGFRYGFQDAATRAGVTGWIRNRRDGRVEALVEGSAEQLRAILAWARQGPPGARVDAVIETDAAGEASAHTRFEQRQTV